MRSPQREVPNEKSPMRSPQLSEVPHRLYNAYSTCNKVTLSAIKSLLQESGVSYSMVAGRSGSDQLLKYSVIPSESQLVLANTLPRYTRTVQLLAVDRSASLQVLDSYVCTLTFSLFHGVITYNVISGAKIWQFLYCQIFVEMAGDLSQ